MTIAIRRNGGSGKSDAERLGDIRELLLSDASRWTEDKDVYVFQLRGRVRKYERRYEMSSETMLRELGDGKIRETRDIMLWSWSWRTLREIEGVTPTTGTR